MIVFFLFEEITGSADRCRDPGGGVTVVSVLDKRQASTRRLAQSTTANR